MKLDSDDFELFGVPRRFAQDPAQLDARWKALQGEVHPDRFAAQGGAAQRVAMQWAVRVNGAYRRLRDPLQRAMYLCELNGAPIEAENNTAMPATFLMQQMQWREALEEAPDGPAVAALEVEVLQMRERLLEDVRQLLDERIDAGQASQRVRALMFVERFRHDIEQRLEALGQ
jgi:molecular chaperone HscB